MYLRMLVLKMAMKKLLKNLKLLDLVVMIGGMNLVKEELLDCIDLSSV